jgi:hypothetical protein
MFGGAAVWRLRKHAASGQSPTGCKQREVVVYLLQRRWGKADLVSSILSNGGVCMAMFRIAGSFRITGAQPDGDAAHAVDGSIVLPPWL